MTQADLKRAEKQLERETLKQIDIIYGASAIALWEFDSWRTERLIRLFDLSEKIWNECGETLDVSIFTMLEAETGLEMKLNINGVDRSYKEFCFTNPTKTYNNLDKASYIFMRKRQAVWLGAGVQAGIFLALHRKYGYGYERLFRVYQHTNEVRKKYKDQPEALRKGMLKICGVNFVDKATRKKMNEEMEIKMMVEEDLRAQLQALNEKEFMINMADTLEDDDRKILYQIHEDQKKIKEQLRRFEDDGK